MIIYCVDYNTSEDCNYDIKKNPQVQMQREAEESLEKMKVSIISFSMMVVTFMIKVCSLIQQKLHERHEQELEQLQVDLKEEAKQQLAQQKEAMSLKHQEEIRELKEEHEAEVKVYQSLYNQDTPYQLFIMLTDDLELAQSTLL